MSTLTHPTFRFVVNPLRRGVLLCFCGFGVLAGCSTQVPAITTGEQERLAVQDQEKLFTAQQPLTGPLTLHEAMARALKYNLDLRLKRMEEVLAKGQEDVARLDLLPKWTQAAGYSDRAPDTSSVSQSMATGMVSNEPTVSSSSTSRTADLTLSWNLLDFGMSYYQARQEGNKALIQAEYRRKAAHNLLKDVRFAFWKAAAAQWLEREIAAIMKASDEAIVIARKVENEGLRSPVHALQFQLGLLEIVRQLERSRAELAMAREELATLINLEPGAPFQLVDESRAMETTQELGMPVEEMERMALSARPELRIEHYQARIEADETRKAIARLFPGLEFAVSASYDDNAFLVYQHWAQAGARLSWNLLRTLMKKPQMDLAESRENVVQIRRMVLHMAVVGQTRIAFHEYRAARDALQRLIVESQTRRRLQDHTANRSGMGLDSQLSYVHNVAAAALGRIQQYEAFARYQSALGRLFATLGMDHLSEENAHQEVLRVTRRLRENDAQWSRLLFQPPARQPMVNDKSMTPLPLADLVARERVERPAPPPAPPPVQPSGADQGNQQVAVPNLPKEPTIPPKASPVAPAPVVEPPPQTSKEPSRSEKTRAVNVVQVASTLDPSKVEPMLARLKEKGYRPDVNPLLDSEGRAVYQIWIGRFAKYTDAVTLRDKYQKKERQPAFIRLVEE